jgi:hypothetical protein
MSKIATDHGVAERAIILLLLRDDHPAPWTRKEIRHECYDIKRWVIDQALTRLEGEGCVTLAGKEVWGSLCARRLDYLGLIAI